MQFLRSVQRRTSPDARATRELASVLRTSPLDVSDPLRSDAGSRFPGNVEGLSGPGSIIASGYGAVRNVFEPLQ